MKDTSESKTEGSPGSRIGSQGRSGLWKRDLPKVVSLTAMALFLGVILYRGFTTSWFGFGEHESFERQYREMRILREALALYSEERGFLPFDERGEQYALQALEPYIEKTYRKMGLGTGVVDFFRLPVGKPAARAHVAADGALARAVGSRYSYANPPDAKWMRLYGVPALLCPPEQEAVVILAEKPDARSDGSCFLRYDGSIGIRFWGTNKVRSCLAGQTITLEQEVEYATRDEGR